MYLALLWHQHQPLYRDPTAVEPAGSLLLPWVRLHAIRDYYSMAALATERPGIRVSVSLSPVLLDQLDDYLERGRTDGALELTLAPAEALGSTEREAVLGSFFEADWHNQIAPHPRYAELFRLRQEGAPFDTQDLRDLQMWFSLAWFGSEFREAPVDLVTGDRVTVHRFVEKGAGFTDVDVRAMVEDQYRVMRAVVPLHRRLQEEGRLEVSTTPAFHPILPLLIDTDSAMVDRPGARLPSRFAYPGDAREQVRRARAEYERRFGRAPSGMWPAEGAVSGESVRIMAEADLRWTATDEGVLARSGRWGYRVQDPNVLFRPYRTESDGAKLAVFFRERTLSDRIGFAYQHRDDPEAAARDFVDEVKERSGDPGADRLVTVVLDGENAWGAYRDDGRPFLRALYRRLEEDPDLTTVTFREYLEGNPQRGVPAHPIEGLEPVHQLFTGSWIDEAGSAPGVDLGTWIGEDEENRAWELLGRARLALYQRGREGGHGSVVEERSEALDSILAAEGSDWFWWFGHDQDSRADPDFDELFRGHLAGVYAGLGLEPPSELRRYIVQRAVVWTFAAPVERIHPRDSLLVRTNCPGVLRWNVDGGEVRTGELVAVGGVMAGARRFQISLGPFEFPRQAVRFRFLCRHPSCLGRGPFCSPDEKTVRVEGEEGET